MLYLTRKLGQVVAVTLPDGQVVRFVITRIGDVRVQVGVEAPQSCDVRREDGHGLTDKDGRA